MASFESSRLLCGARGEAPEGARASPAHATSGDRPLVKGLGEVGQSSVKTTPAAAMGSAGKAMGSAGKMRSPARGGAGLLVPRGNGDGRVAITGASLASQKFQIAPRSPENLTRVARSPGQGGRPGLPYQRGDRRERSPVPRIAQSVPRGTPFRRRRAAISQFAVAQLSR